MTTPHRRKTPTRAARAKSVQSHHSHHSPPPSPSPLPPLPPLLPPVPGESAPSEISVSDDEDPVQLWISLFQSTDPVFSSPRQTRQFEKFIQQGIQPYEHCTPLWFPTIALKYGLRRWVPVRIPDTGRRGPPCIVEGEDNPLCHRYCLPAFMYSLDNCSVIGILLDLDPSISFPPPQSAIINHDTPLSAVDQINGSNNAPVLGIEVAKPTEHLSPPRKRSRTQSTDYLTSAQIHPKPVVVEDVFLSRSLPPTVQPLPNLPVGLPDHALSGPDHSISQGPQSDALPITVEPQLHDQNDSESIVQDPLSTKAKSDTSSLPPAPPPVRLWRAYRAEVQSRPMEQISGQPSLGAPIELNATIPVTSSASDITQDVTFSNPSLPVKPIIEHDNPSTQMFAYSTPRSLPAGHELQRLRDPLDNYLNALVDQARQHFNAVEAIRHDAAASLDHLIARSQRVWSEGDRDREAIDEVRRERDKHLATLRTLDTRLVHYSQLVAEKTKLVEEFSKKVLFLETDLETAQREQIAVDQRMTQAIIERDKAIQERDFAVRQRSDMDLESQQARKERDEAIALRLRADAALEDAYLELMQVESTMQENAELRSRNTLIEAMLVASQKASTDVNYVDFGTTYPFKAFSTGGHICNTSWREYSSYRHPAAYFSITTRFVLLKATCGLFYQYFKP
ncbi:hypothetical protein TREMEDRAFT_66203 [Tremella mesenterica DSM 1558]|uniref:uncharacterized protein n=1 Tax=Tremella mesenterica (strain ATCC 24925 / CBS 8224 / DSM 1558 / NBRC 9311 / NRRL Y-6157 / RJB 2259-6 / UBC 559-6) TaxID=578456 RepID=UPI00032CA06C|nr:uncharacterized protein TREMEDRAFT_66203 [Tremella mesenterica DSM 1558]EIW65835.1 hypothetical protein TREMEDRAFT_66203 [Tremella mesenterica DSM 1558]